MKIQNNLKSIFLTEKEIKLHFQDWKILELDQELDLHVLKKLEFKRQMIKISIFQWLSYLTHMKNPYEKPWLELPLLKKIKIIIKKEVPFYIERKDLKVPIKYNILEKDYKNCLSKLNLLKTFN